MTEKRKVLVYVVKNGKLLVFRHRDYSCEEVGIQVPAGTIKDEEDPETAALRELQEETGFKGYRITSLLGTATYDMSPTKPEIHHRYFFLAEPTEDLPERWESKEEHDGEQAPTFLECFWIPLDKAHVLSAGQSALVSEIKYK